MLEEILEAIKQIRKDLAEIRSELNSPKCSQPTCSHRATQQDGRCAICSQMAGFYSA